MKWFLIVSSLSGFDSGIDAGPRADIFDEQGIPMPSLHECLKAAEANPGSKCLGKQISEAAHPLK